MEDITKKPYAKWLEDGLRAITEGNPRSIAFVAIMEDGDVFTGYYNAGQQDKAIMAHNIQIDSLFDVIRNNGEILKEAIDDIEEDKG